MIDANRFQLLQWQVESEFHLPFFFNTRLCVVLIGTAKRNTGDDRKATQLRHFNEQREPSQQLWPVRDGVLLQRRSPEVTDDPSSVFPFGLLCEMRKGEAPRLLFQADQVQPEPVQKMFPDEQLLEVPTLKPSPQ